MIFEVRACNSFHYFARKNIICRRRALWAQTASWRTIWAWYHIRDADTFVVCYIRSGLLVCNKLWTDLDGHAEMSKSPPALGIPGRRESEQCLSGPDGEGHSQTSQRQLLSLLILPRILIITVYATILEAAMCKHYDFALGFIFRYNLPFARLVCSF